MAVDREGVYTALLARLQAKATSIPAANMSRRWRDINDQQDLPALYVVAGDEQVRSNEKGLPTIRILHATLWLYVKTDDGASAPSTILNPLIMNIETALELQPGEAWGPATNAFSATTLGGKCSRCYVGDVEIGEGTKSGVGVAILHVIIVVTS